MVKRKFNSDSKALFLTPDLKHNDEWHRVLVKVLANPFDFYANSGSTGSDRKNRRIKTGRPNKFLLQSLNNRGRDLELRQQKQKKGLLKRHFISKTGPIYLTERTGSQKISSSFKKRDTPVTEVGLAERTGRY